MNGLGEGCHQGKTKNSMLTSEFREPVTHTGLSSAALWQLKDPPDHSGISESTSRTKALQEGDSSPIVPSLSPEHSASKGQTLFYIDISVSIGLNLHCIEQHSVSSI